MTHSSDASAAAIAVQFLQIFVEDRANGSQRQLHEYQALFPGHEEVIAAEHASIAGGETSAAANDVATHDYPADGQRYRDPVEIGRGGMGRVIKVIDPSLGREVAMKLLVGESGELPDAARLRRFLHEAKITAQLQHPSIVAVHEIGIDSGGSPYYTMPLISGQSLQRIVAAMHVGESDDWSLVRAVGVLHRVASAVAHAHLRGIIHRDLKPANVMVGGNGETFVVDWGVARRLEQATHTRTNSRHSERSKPANEPAASLTDLDQSALTVEGDVLGTPAYMSPEQALGNVEAVGPHSDVYSLGAMLYHLLAGRAPFAGPDDAPSSRETLALVQQGPPIAIAQIAKDAPSELISICERAMARDPSDRYPSAAELARDLDAFLEGRVVRAHASGALAELRKWMQRNRTAAASLLFAAVALIAGLVISLVLKSDADHNAKSAEDSFALSADAIDQLFAQVTSSDYESEPGTDPIRRAIANRALAWFKLLREKRPGAAADMDVALAYSRIGIIESSFGQLDAARESLETSLQIYRSLIDRLPSPELRRRLAFVEANILMIRGKDGEDTLEGFERLAAEARDLLAANPDAEPMVRLLEFVLVSTLPLQQRKRMFDAAEATSAEHLKVCRVLFDLRPNSWSGFRKLASAHRGNAGLMAAQKDHPAAATGYRSAIELLESGLEIYKGHRILRYDRCRMLNSLGTALARQGQNKEAMQTFQQSLAAGRELVAGYPDRANYQCELAASLCNLGITRGIGTAREAATTNELFDDARKHIRLALALSYEAKFANYYGNVVRSWTKILSHQDRLDECRVLLTELQQALPGKPIVPVATAMQCATLIATDTSRSDEARTAVAKPFYDMVMSQLTEAYDRGLIQPRMPQWNVFRPLRTRDDFRALLARIKRDQAKKP